MNRYIQIAGIDPAMRNTGLALGAVNVITGELEAVTTVVLIETATNKDTKKVVRKSSDDLRCGREIIEGIRRFYHDWKPAFFVGEVPTGTQSARGSFSNGLCCGVLASLPAPLIEVSPTEVKVAAVGHKYAAKEEMIEWAVARWPRAGWLTRNIKGQVKLLDKNEHLADACGALMAGVKTAQFQQALQVYRQMSA